MFDIADRHFVLRENMIGAIPIEVGDMRSLTALDLSLNNMNTIPRELGNCPALRSLNARAPR